MKCALIDASSAILLYKAGLFTAVSGAFRLKAAPAVLREISVADRAGAPFFRQAHHNGTLRTADPGLTTAPVCISSLGDGERETVMAFSGGQGDFIIIDDGRGAAACRRLNIPHINALLCPRLLNWAGLIDRSARDTGFDRLLSIGRYSRQVIDHATAATADRLSRFLPTGRRLHGMPVGSGCV